MNESGEGIPSDNVGQGGRVFVTVCRQLALHARAGVDYHRLSPETLLIADLGLDSLKFVDLTVALEEAFELNEFPMQQWVDSQTELGRPLSVGELALACVQAISAEGQEQPQ